MQPANCCRSLWIAVSLGTSTQSIRSPAPAASKPSRGHVWSGCSWMTWAGTTQHDFRPRSNAGEQLAVRRHPRITSIEIDPQEHRSSVSDRSVLQLNLWTTDDAESIAGVPNYFRAWLLWIKLSTAPSSITQPQRLRRQLLPSVSCAIYSQAQQCH